MSTTVIITWIHFRDIANFFLDRAGLWLRKRMAESEVRRCLDWLEQKKSELELADFGGSKQLVTDANTQHFTSRAQVLEYRKQMDKLAKKQTLTDAELQAMYGAYHTLETIVDKKSGCLEMIQGISSLEDHIQGISTEFDSRSVHLVNVLQNNRQKKGKGLDNETLVKATQSCMSAVRESWRWLDEVMQCAHVHLSNAASYHQFFHDVEETDYFMNSTLSNIHTTFRKNNLNGDRADLNQINAEIKDTLMAYLRWQSKVDNLVARSRDVVPVHRRTQPCKDPQLVIALASYKTDGLEFEEGETLTLLDTTDKARWKVKNGKNQTGVVPAVLLLINGPTGEALDAAIRLRLQLLGLWTISVKRLGTKMIAFMQLVFRDWSDDEIKAIKQMPPAEKAELQRVLKRVEAVLNTTWRGYEGFEDLQEKIARLSTILNEPHSGTAKGGKVPEEVVVQIKILDGLLSGYQDFWTYWETYKVTTEMSRQPKFILVCDKWDQLRFTTSAHYVRFWDTNLLASTDGGKQRFKAEASLTIHETPSEKLDKGQGGIMPVKTKPVESAPISEQMDKSQVNKKDGNVKFPDDEWRSSTDSYGYGISTSMNGGDEIVKEEMSKTNAAKKDINFPDDFVTSSESSQNFSMSQQFGAGDQDGDQWSMTADVTETSQRRETTMDEVQMSTEEIQTTFVVKKVFHPTTGKLMSLEEAVAAGIIDQGEGMFNNIETGERYSLTQAMTNGDVTVDIKSQKRVKQQETSYGLVTIKTSQECRPYTVTSVLDPHTEQEMTLEEAEKKRIVDLTDGYYFAENGDRMDIVDAIHSGLVKAEFHGKPSDVTEVSKTYAVTGVVDQRNKEKIPFRRAINRAIFDPEDGMYVNNVTRERIPFTDAVMKGLIKARVVTDASAMNIDPSNRVVVERLASAQQKIIKQVRVAKAFKKAAHVNGKK